jgi:hypothetical protein
MITKTIHCFKCKAKLENLELRFDDFMEGKMESIELLKSLGWSYILGKCYCAVCKNKVIERSEK